MRVWVAFLLIGRSDEERLHPRKWAARRGMRLASRFLRARKSGNKPRGSSGRIRRKPSLPLRPHDIECSAPISERGQLHEPGFSSRTSTKCGYARSRGVMKASSRPAAGMRSRQATCRKVNTAKAAVGSLSSSREIDFASPVPVSIRARPCRPGLCPIIRTDLMPMGTALSLA